MNKQISQKGKFGYFDLTFEYNSEIVKYYKDSGGECWHDVKLSLIETWAKGHGYLKDLDLIDFLDEKLSNGLAQDFISYVEANTTPTHTWVSMGDMDS